jgi:peptidoglycan/LPS O-acetylase OafA/YrhL
MKFFTFVDIFLQYWDTVNNINMSKLTYYRPDIDGLRAFAVMSVILFHLGIPRFTGGFVGVDIFFVISGYLITLIILREIREGRFSLLHFWERRVRRIIPTLTTVVFTTVIASYFITLYPVDFKAFGLTVVAQSIFLINILFMRQTAYFSAPVDTIPLLHTWSLAVEEQFYILFPLLLFIVYRYARKYVFSILALLALSSIVLSIYFININPSASFTIPFLPPVWGGATNLSAGFYFFPARAWELLTGALLAGTTLCIASKKYAEVLSLLGFFGLLYSFFVISADDVFPGYIALIPVLSTAAIIFANTKHDTFIKKFLSFPIFIWVGLISYSLYLWHWPIIVLAKQYWITGLPADFRIVVLLLTFSLSIITYRFIETPFRNKNFIPRKLHVFSLAATVSIVLLITGFYIFKNNGIPLRAPESAQVIAIAATDFNPRRDECFKNNIQKVLSGGKPCTLGIQTNEQKIDFVLWGDSHANAVMPAFDELAIERRLSGVFFGIGGCSPLVTEFVISKDDGCKYMKQNAIDYINEHQVKKVYLVSNWKESYGIVGSDSKISLERSLNQTIKLLPKNQELILFKKVPRQEYFNVREAFYTAGKKEFSINELSIPYTKHISSTKNIHAVIDRISTQRYITSQDPASILCNNSECPLSKDENILYRDKSHINTTGSKLLKSLILF